MTAPTLRGKLRSLVDRVTGLSDERWGRVVMNRESRRLITQLDPSRLRALEISGGFWRHTGFKEYERAAYPEFDVCAAPLPRTFDLIIAEQVFEHLLWPYRAGKNVHAMLAPDGYVFLSTPFLVRIHNHPVDCTRWTEVGLRHFLAECGFPIDRIVTGSWGNRACVEANFHQWVPFRSRLHSLVNEPDFPYVVWALAQKSS